MDPAVLRRGDSGSDNSNELSYIPCNNCFKIVYFRGDTSDRGAPWKVAGFQKDMAVLLNKNSRLKYSSNPGNDFLPDDEPVLAMPATERFTNLNRFKDYQIIIRGYRL